MNHALERNQDEDQDVFAALVLKCQSSPKKKGHFLTLSLHSFKKRVI